MTAAILALNARTFRSLKKHRNYRLFFSGQVVSVTGTWMQNIALAWFVVQLTHSPLAIGALAFFRFLPFTLFGLVSGVIADRFDYRRLVMATQAALMVVSVGLAALAFSGRAQLWEVYVLAALSGVALVFDATGRHALTYQMVGREELPNAVALNSSLFNASRIIGPSIAGILVAFVGVGICFAINAVTFLVILAALALMRADELFQVEKADRGQSVVRGVREGLGFVRRNPQVRLVLALVTVVSTVGFNFHVILPILASETLEAGPRTFGLLSAFFGAGALTGALLSAALARTSWKALLAGTAGFSIALLVLAPQQTVVAAALLLYVTGVCFTVWTSNSQSILQLSTPDALRGRVLSIHMFAFNGLAPLGSLFSGWLCEVGGTRLALSVAGVVTLLFTAFALRERSRHALPGRAIPQDDQRLAA
jgi:MFS family permease